MIAFLFLDRGTVSLFYDYIYSHRLPKGCWQGWPESSFSPENAWAPFAALHTSVWLQQIVFGKQIP